MTPEDTFGKLLELGKARCLVEKCEQIRKAESRTDAGKWEWLERRRWMCLKNRVNRTENESRKWESISMKRPEMSMAYEVRMVLQGAYE